MDTKTLCLAALSLGDASGYEIKKLFEEGPFSHFYDAGFGSIYPALNKLLGEGQVSCREIDQPGRPAKKIYALTPPGWRALEDALAAKPAADKVRSDSLTMLFFAAHLGSEHLARVYDGYLAGFEAFIARLAEDEDCDMTAGHRLVRGFGEAVYGAAARYLAERRDEFLEEDRAEREAARAREAAGGAR